MECTPCWFHKRSQEGYPIVILEILEVLGGLGRWSWTLWANVEGRFAWLWTVWQSSSAIVGRPLEVCWEVLARFWVSCLGPRWHRIPEAIGNSVAPRGRRFQSGLFMDVVSKISSPGDHKSVFELKNLNVKFISAFSTQTQFFVLGGCQHGPMLASQIPENLSLEGVWASPGRSWAAPRSFFVLPRSTRKVA